MDKRHSSPSPRAYSPRPSTHRQRSNSLPLVEALGCSTQEAELILAEGRAAVRRRHATQHRRGRRTQPECHDSIFRPQDHLQHLNGDRGPVEDGNPGDAVPAASNAHHTRTPSILSDASTITGPTAVPHSPGVDQSSRSPTSPLWDYSANLAKFIQTQLDSISSYYPNMYPRSCPDLNLRLQHQTPPQSSDRTERRLVGTPGILEMPPLRAPLRSAFSAWSSTDDETDNESSPLPDIEQPTRPSIASNFTPSILRYYENVNDSTFLLSSTPGEEGEKQQHASAGNLASLNQSPPLTTTSKPHSTPGCHMDYPSSTLSTHPQLTSSSVPSLSSASTASYFDSKRRILLAPHVKDRIIAAVSPFEGRAVANVHDIMLESRDRVLVDGMSFDLVQSSNMPDESAKSAPKVQTSC